MSGLIIREYQPRDASAVKRMINEAFYIHKYARSPKLLDSALELYLAECLAASSYAKVAEIQGHTVGILMGRVAKHRYLPGRQLQRLSVLYNLAKIGLTGFRERATLLQYFAFDGAYKRLRQHTTAPLTNELTLFAVDASTRGSGVGSALYQEYMEYLRAHGRSDFYLYTDSLCTFEFYERQGMTRAAAETIDLSFDDVSQQVGVYLYTGTA